MEDPGLGAHTECKNTDKASNNTSRDYVDYKMIRWNKSAAENLFDDMDKIPDTAVNCTKHSKFNCIQL